MQHPVVLLAGRRLNQIKFCEHCHLDIRCLVTSLQYHFYKIGRGSSRAWYVKVLDVFQHPRKHFGRRDPLLYRAVTVPGLYKYIIIVLFIRFIASDRLYVRDNESCSTYST
jgi:hypothetical protein